MPRCRAFDVGMAKQKLHSSKVASAAVDQRRLRMAQRVSAEQMRVQPDARDPVRHEPRVLSCRHGLTGPPPAGEQKFAGPLAGLVDVRVSTAWRVCSVNSNRTGCPVFLCRTVARKFAWRLGSDQLPLFRGVRLTAGGVEL
jgi:hypothetical protein